MNDKPLLLSNVTHGYGALEVLRDVTIEIERGEFVAVVGPSGCGKTTILNLLSGHEKPSAGTVTRAGRARTVYQQHGLFPWLTAGENIALGLRDVTDNRERTRQLFEMIQLIGLEGFEDQYPHRLSGGMRQRVELGRAIVGRSDVLLMDEPFSALDYLTRLRLRQELVRILTERPRTVVLVTHDIEEAAQLADRIIVLSERPAVIRHELRLTVERPRALTHPRVVAAVHEILAVLGFEHEGAAAPVGESE